MHISNDCISFCFLNDEEKKSVDCLQIDLTEFVIQLKMKPSLIMTLISK